MNCAAPECPNEAIDTLVYEGRTRPFCANHYELAKMAMVILEHRVTTGTNPDFETVNTAMDRGH